MKDKFHLVTSTLEETWDFKQKNLFAGEWCKLYSRRSRWQELDHTTCSYHWDNREKYYEDSQNIIDILLSLDLHSIKNRNHADEMLYDHINEKFLRTFLLQNLELDSFSFLHFGHVILSSKLFVSKSSNCFFKSNKTVFSGYNFNPLLSSSIASLVLSNLIKPTIHRYLSGQMKSQIRRIDADEFTIATLLPVQRFKKASESEVWKDCVCYAPSLEVNRNKGLNLIPNNPIPRLLHGDLWKFRLQRIKSSNETPNHPPTHLASPWWLFF